MNHAVSYPGLLSFRLVMEEPGAYATPVPEMSSTVKTTLSSHDSSPPSSKDSLSIDQVGEIGGGDEAS